MMTHSHEAGENSRQPEPMKAAAMIIGDEILSGNVTDTNTPWLAKLLFKLVFFDYCNSSPPKKSFHPMLRSLAAFAFLSTRHCIARTRTVQAWSPKSASSAQPGYSKA